MDYLMNNISSLIEKMGSKIPSLSIPWHQYFDAMILITPYLAKANIFFPVDTALIIVSIRFIIAGVMLTIWTIVFIRKLLPF